MEDFHRDDSRVKEYLINQCAISIEKFSEWSTLKPQNVGSDLHGMPLQNYQNVVFQQQVIMCVCVGRVLNSGRG